MEYPKKNQKLFSPKGSKKKEINFKNPKKAENKEINKVNNEVSILNNKENAKKEGGGFLITEMLDIEPKNEEKKNNEYLKDKYPEINNTSDLINGIKSSLTKANNDIKKKFLEENLSINNNSTYNHQLNLLLKNKIEGKNSKILKSLKENEKSLSFNIGKLTKKQKLFEGLLIPKGDKVGYNNKMHNLKIIKTNKENLMKKLESVNEQIEQIILKESSIDKKEKSIPDYRILDDKQEEYNKHLLTLGKKSNYTKIKYQDKMKSSYEKRKNEIDQKERESLEVKEKLFNEKINSEKQLILKRKKINDELTDNTNKYIHGKTKSPENYIYQKYKEKFDENQKKIFYKIRNQKNESLLRKEDFEEFQKKVDEHKKLLEINNIEKKKKLLELWLYRSQTLPSYHHPLIKYVEEESNNRKKELEELEKRKKECNDLEKRNYKPPKVIINKVLRKEVEDRKFAMNKDNIRKLRLNNKILRFKKIDIKSPTNKHLEHQFSYDKYNNTNLKVNTNKNKKNLLKPIKIMSPKSNKHIDYLSVILSQRKNISSKNKKSLEKIKKDNDNSKIAESLITEKNKLEDLDKRINKKKKLLHKKDVYTNDFNLVDQVGKLLIDSVKSKLNVLSKFCED